MKKSFPYFYKDNAPSLITQHRPRSKSRIRSRSRMKRKPLALIAILPFTISITLAFITPSQLRTKSNHNLQSSVTKLNGIKGFRGWFESQFPDAISEIPRANSQETFDHVLIDINQLLHISLRRSRNDDQALATFMSELNSCIEFAMPRRSLVLAMDGSASAAKLATSRKRRLSTIVKSDWKEKQLDRFRRQSKKLALSEKQVKMLRERYQADVKTLRITTGTDFMDRANNALLYWAWQRMLTVGSPLSKVSIYISSSISPGEGEIKIIDWIIQKRPKGTVGIIGGDSDLVLEGLLIPPSICTHNVFVLLPDMNKKYQVVSIWETTRHMAQLLPQVEAKDIMHARTDLALLLMLNGNDYLPKLRGSSGFDRVFQSYITVVKKWLKKGHNRPFLIDPQSLVFNREFAIQFFFMLKSTSSRSSLDSPNFMANQFNPILSPLGQLNNLVSSRFMPKPMRWKMLLNAAGGDEEENDDEDDEEEDEDEEDDTFGDEEEDDDDLDEDDSLFSLNMNPRMLRLTIGKKGSKDYRCYETKHAIYSKIKDTKNELATIALDDLMGPDYIKTTLNDTSYATLSTYDWEIDHPAEASCERYLTGLIWNLQTYQDGICSDYGYNYGKRLAPTAESIIEYFQSAIDENRQVGKKELLGFNFTSPMSNGVSCLAALPAQLHELIAEPHSWIPSERVDELYGECVSPVDNVFDMQKFKDLCRAELAPIIKKRANKTQQKGKNVNQKTVELETGSWTIIYRNKKQLETPFQPPEPVVDRFRPLFANPRIKAARLTMTLRPYERKAWLPWVENLEDNNETILSEEIDFSSIDGLLARENGGNSTISDVTYFIPYADKWGKRSKKKKAAKSTKEPKGTKSTKEPKAKKSMKEPKRKKQHKEIPRQVYINDDDLYDRIKEFKMEIDPSVHPEKSIHGMTPLGGLMELANEGLIKLEWRSLSPSPTEFASINPGAFECHELIIRKIKMIDSTCGDKVTVRRDREISRGNKRRLRQYLASMALTKILENQDKNWYEMTNQEIKEIFTPVDPLLPPLSPEMKQRMKDFNIKPLVDERSRTGAFAMTYLSKLRNEKYIDFEIEYIQPSRTAFASFAPECFICTRLCVHMGEKKLAKPFSKLIFERDRFVFSTDKSIVRNHLAGMALTELAGGEKWTKFSPEEMLVYAEDGIVPAPATE